MMKKPGFLFLGLVLAASLQSLSAQNSENEPCSTPTWLGVRDITYDSAGFVAWEPVHKILRLIAAEDTTTYDWGTATSFAVSGLLPETEYIAEIRAVCAPGDSSDWGAATTFTTEKAPCPTPTWLGVRDITYDSAGFVTFSPESKILRLIAAEDTTTYDWGTATSFAVSGLLPETEYIAEIRAVCAPGDSSDWGAATTFTTEEAPVVPICGIPSQLESQCDSLSAELQWIPGENNIAFNLIYKLEENQTYDTLSTVDSYTALIGLAPGSYRWTVRGLCNNDTSDFAEEVGFDIEQLANQTRQTFGLNCFMQEGRLHILNPGNILIKRVQIFNSIGQCLSTMETQTSLDMQIEFPIQHQVLLVLILTDQGRVSFKIYAR